MSVGSGTRKLALILAAVTAISVPAAAYFAAEAFMRHKLQSYLDTTAQTVLQRIDGAVDRALVSLHDAETRNVAGCSPTDREALRVLVFESPVLKELAVHGPDGAVRCNNIGSLVQITPASTPFVTANPRVSLAVAVTRGAHGRALRVFWNPDGTILYGGIMSVGLFVPHQVIQRGNSGLGIDVELVPGGRLVSVRGAGAVEGSRQFSAVAVSGSYPIRVVATASEGAWRLEHGGIIWLAVVVGIVLAGLMAAVLLAICRRRDPMADMHRALVNGEFIPYYQPILDIDTGRIIGCEVLVRWRKPDGTIIPPGAFIGEAERSGFIFPLTLDLMRQAAAEVGSLYAARPHMKCGFNLCAAHFQDQSIVEDVINVFSGTELKLNQVLLEVTERDPLPDMELARAIIARFQDLGVRVALDDVGTGHGGMSYLLKLRVDVMKIDKLFIDAIGSERQSTAIVDSLIDLAAHLNLDVVAEGVETFDQVEALRRRGVRSAQGYVFAPPLPGSSFVQLVEAMEPAAATAWLPRKKSLRG
ncbi:EAL domain-containing protein [Phreatobacter sp.]|uniref:EAL domain-containing protein n=1 Tax=Phreatobacter sp. TaxID=1966341 RepID=UPI003F6FF649